MNAGSIDMTSLEVPMGRASPWSSRRTSRPPHLFEGCARESRQVAVDQLAKIARAAHDVGADLFHAYRGQSESVSRGNPS